MISMYSDAALPISFGSATAPGPARFFRHPEPDRKPRATTDVFFDREKDWPTEVSPPSGDRLHDDALDAVRGLALSVVLGLGCWAVIGAAVVVVRAVFF